MSDYPEMLHTVLDATQPRELAEFYRQLLGFHYRVGDEEPVDGSGDDADWLVLLDESGNRRLAIQQVDHLPRTTWPSPEIPMQLHVDFTVLSAEELERQRNRCEGLGGEVILDRTDDSDEPLYVFADPAGHPFCIFVA